PNQPSAADTTMANARAEAQSFAHQNKGGGVALSLGDNNNNGADGDIVCGYLAHPENYSDAMVRTVPGTGPVPNSVQGIVHRDNTRNNPLALFFARAVGMDRFNMRVTATATYEDGITGFSIRTPGYSTCKLLPFALDVNTWNAILAGSGPDDFTRD